MDDAGIHHRINDLVRAEHELRAKLADGTIDPAGERQQLKQLEESLDQCWDLLRQRDARRHAGEDPDGAAARPVGEVEGYVQ